MREGIRWLTSFGIALIRQFTVTMNSLVAAPLQFCADRRFASAGNAFNQIVSLAHGSMISLSHGCCAWADLKPWIHQARPMVTLQRPRRNLVSVIVRRITL